MPNPDDQGIMPQPDSSPLPVEAPRYQQPPVPRAPTVTNDVLASDADRAQIQALLSDAYTGGKLSYSEFNQRTDQAWKSRYRGELRKLVSDVGPTDRRLPEPSAGKALANRVTGGDGPAWSLALMGGTDRIGQWTLPEQHTAVATMGGITLDLREADFQASVCTITAIALMGGVEIIVPDDVNVEINGVGIMGGFGGKARRMSAPNIRPGAPTIRVSGIALMGGVDVVRKAWEDD